MNHVLLEVFFWSFDAADVCQQQSHELAAYLTDDEWERTARFKFDHLKQSFTLGRGWTRKILAMHLKCEPMELQFEHGAFGKPSVKHSAPKFSFNFSRSQLRFVCGVTMGRGIGVDIEQIRNFDKLRETAPLIFDAEEFQAWQSTESVSEFYRTWTRKESIVKALGTGLTSGLTEIDISREPHGDAMTTVLFEGHKFLMQDVHLDDPQFAACFSIHLATDEDADDHHIEQLAESQIAEAPNNAVLTVPAHTRLHIHRFKLRPATPSVDA